MARTIRDLPGLTVRVVPGAWRVGDDPQAMFFTAPPPPPITVSTDRWEVPVIGHTYRWCTPAAEIPPAEWPTGAPAGTDPVCGSFPKPAFLGLPTCGDGLRQGFGLTVAPGEAVRIAGILPVHGTARVRITQGDVTVDHGPLTEWRATGAGATWLSVETSGPRGDVTYTTLIGVVRGTTPPKARVRVLGARRVVEIRLSAPTRVRACFGARQARDLGVVAGPVVRLRVPDDAWNTTAIGLSTPDGITTGPIPIRGLHPAPSVRPPAVRLRGAGAERALEATWSPWCLGVQTPGLVRRGPCTYWRGPWVETDLDRCTAAITAPPQLVVRPGTRVRPGPMAAVLGRVRVERRRDGRPVGRHGLTGWVEGRRGVTEVDITTESRFGRVVHRGEVVATDDPRPPGAGVRTAPGGRAMTISLARPTRVSLCVGGGPGEAAVPRRLGLLAPGLHRVPVPAGARVLRVGLRSGDGLAAPPRTIRP